jgi:hypothetical protein
MNKEAILRTHELHKNTGFLRHQFLMHNFIQVGEWGRVRGHTLKKYVAILE